MKTAWEPSIGDGQVVPKSADACPRCGCDGRREHLMQTNGVGFYRCSACGHMFIVRSTPTAPAKSA
jgi:transposase-like protein